MYGVRRGRLPPPSHNQTNTPVCTRKCTHTRAETASIYTQTRARAHTHTHGERNGQGGQAIWSPILNHMQQERTRRALRRPQRSRRTQLAPQGGVALTWTERRGRRHVRVGRRRVPESRGGPASGHRQRLGGLSSLLLKIRA